MDVLNAGTAGSIFCQSVFKLFALYNYCHAPVSSTGQALKTNKNFTHSDYSISTIIKESTSL